MKKSFLLILLILFSFSIFAQESSKGFQSTNNASAYVYNGSIAGSEQLKIYTYIWGQVKKPGMYIVPDDTDLLALISLAGGPTTDAKLSKVRIVRPTADGKKIIWVDVKKYLETGDETLIPTLKPGDTVILSGTIYYAFSRAVDFLSKVTIAISVYSVIKGN